MSRLGDIFDRGIAILNSFRNTKTNTMTVSLGDDEGGITESTGAEWWQHVGFASRPSKVSQDENERKKSGGPQAVILRGSDRDCVIASRDTRCHALYGSLDYGETCVFGSGDDGKAQGRMVIKKDGSVFLYTRAGNSPSGDGMTVALDASKNQLTLINGKGFGIIINEDGITLTAGDAAIEVKASGGINITATKTACIDGKTIALGAKALPLPAFTAIRGPTGVSGAPSTKVLME